MIKKFIVITVTMLLAIASNLLAATNFSDKSIWIPTNAYFGTGNDKWTFGFSRNDDDHLSYGLGAKIEAPIWRFTLDINGYTNRGWKDDWSNPDTFFNGRYDTLESNYTLLYVPYESPWIKVGIYPTIGFVFAGNMHFDFAQNFIHKISKIREVNLPYEGPNIYAPSLGLELLLDVSLFKIHEAVITASISAKSSNYIGFQYSESINLMLKLNMKNGDFLSLIGGYHFIQNGTEWKTQELVNNTVEGWRLGFGVDAGPLQINYYHALKGTQGYAVYMIDAMEFFKPSTWSHSDFYYSIGSMWILGLHHHFASFEFNLFGNFSFEFTNEYIAGNPVDKNNELVDENYFRTKRGFSAYIFSLKYAFPSNWSKDWVRPTLSMGLGFESLSVTLLNNMYRPSEEPFIDNTGYSMLFDFKATLEFLPEDLLLSGSGSFTPAIFGGVHLYTDQAMLNKMMAIGVDSDKVRNYQYYQFYFGFVLKIGLDL